MKVSQFIISVTAVLLTAGFLLLSASPAYALSYGGIGGRPANPIADNPRTNSIFIFNLGEGESTQDGVKVINNTEETKTLLVYATDSQRSTDGSFACEQFSDIPNGVGAWITLEKDEVTLAPSTNEIVNFTVTVPEGADIGESNGCIMIQEKKAGTDPEASGVSLSFRTGLRVVITVPGEQIRKLDITRFDVGQDENSINTKLDVANSGNVSIDAIIKLYTTSIFGLNVGLIENQLPVLRGETSTFNFELPKPIWGGFFNIYAEVEYDPSSAASVGVDTDEPNVVLASSVRTIFIMPELGPLIVEVAALLLFLLLLVFAYKKYQFKKVIAGSWDTYIVQTGDTIDSLAHRYRIKWQILAKVNKIRPPYQLVIGTRIKVPSQS